MDRKITPSQGFTLIELMIVVAMVSIVASMAASRFTQISDRASIQEDMHTISAFLKSQRLNAFTSKETIAITINAGGDLISAVSDPSGVALSTGSIELSNPIISDSSNADDKLFLINSRGLFSNTGTLSLATASQASSENCLTIDASRVRTGTWNETTNDCKLK